MTDPAFDVVVVGCGLAGLSAAIAARNDGARVLVLESAPKALRGGQTAFAASGFRTWRSADPKADLRELAPSLSKDELEAYLVSPYTKDEYYTDVMRVTNERADPRLTRVLVDESLPTARWLREQGLKWQPHSYAMKREGRIYMTPELALVMSEGSGVGMVDSLCAIAEGKGVAIAYETKALRLLLDQKGKISGVAVKDPNGFRDVSSRGVVLAAGGFESNREWRARYLGPGWDNVRPRGSKYNQGMGIAMALAVGAAPAGHWSGCHATAMDWDVMKTPEGEDLKDARRASRNNLEVCVEVNAAGARFIDEGEDRYSFIYVKNGAAIVAQPAQQAWQIFDTKTREAGSFIYTDQPHVTAGTIAELAEKMGAPALVHTLEEYNAAIAADASSPNVTSLDGSSTKGITPPKSNWARRLDSPPFVAYKVTTGITFTFGGIKINERAQVIDTEGNVIPGLYAGGNTMGGIWHHNYAGGSGITTAGVFGRVAGATAARDLR